MAKTVVGLFENPSDAQGAMQDIQSAGFGQNANLVTSASSGLTDIFGQLGIPQDDARLYQAGIQNGGALVILQSIADNDATTAAAILERHNVVDLDNMGRGSADFAQTTTSTGSTGMTTGSADMTTGTSGRRSLYEGGETVIPIVEEELHIGKREVESGGVRVNVEVEETPVNEQVTLRDEEVRVERRRVDQPVDSATAAQAFTEGTVEVRERDEQAVVQKEARVVEEVVVGKEVTDRTETVQDTVRRTDVDVQEMGGQTGSVGSMGTTATGTTGESGFTSTQGSASSTGGDEGFIERNLSRAGNAAEGATGLDLDRDQDVGQRDPRNNI